MTGNQCYKAGDCVSVCAEREKEARNTRKWIDSHPKADKRNKNKKHTTLCRTMYG